MTFIHNNNENKQKKQEDKIREFQEFRAKIGKKAEKKGLTEELLQQLLENQE